jgi:choloylglycine hydrolase
VAYPCSAVVLKDDNRFILAKNFDWTYRNGIIMKNVRGVAKVAYYTHAAQQATWTSTYGSVTFNQNGKDMPYGGMNERGLVVEMLWMEYTRYNINDDKQYVNELEWIQYQLDMYASVSEVIEHLDDLKVYPIKGKIHYILADATGESIIIEYLNGKPVVFRKDPNTCQAITNTAIVLAEPFKDQISGIRKKTTSSIYRYHLLEQQIAKIQNQQEISVPFAFESLKKVTIPKGDFKTMWSMVYSINEQEIAFFTDKHKNQKSISLKGLDFDGDVQYFDINQKAVTDLNNALQTLTEPINHQFMSGSLVHLGFDIELAKELSRHQFDHTKREGSVFEDQYFHFDISIPIDEERQTGFFVVMDSDKSFKKRVSVDGGFLYGTINKGILEVNIYGLRNGRYSMLAFLDSNKNRSLDFDTQGNALEKYATFSDNTFKSMRELTFMNTSSVFSQRNAKISVDLK